MPDKVRPKKKLGQHFLKDPGIAERVASSLHHHGAPEQVLEIGPGMGILTRFLLQDKAIELKVCEIDHESVSYLRKHFPELKDRIIAGDFLEMAPEDIFHGSFSIIGNFPYNISSQILFWALDHRSSVQQVTGMFQREVARRIASPCGNKEYGILSVLMQAYYTCEYLFTVNEGVFQPPPKVKSGVIRLIRKAGGLPSCDDELFRKTVKAAFNQRRKTLKNALAGIMAEKHCSPAALPFRELRAEKLSWEDFVVVTNFLQGKITPSQSGQ